MNAHNHNVTVDLGNGQTATLVVESVNYLDADGSETFRTVPSEGGSAYTVVAGERLDVVEEHNGVFTIPQSRMETLQAKINKVARKAEKVGCVPPSFDIIGMFEVDQRTPQEVEIGFAPRYEMFNLVTVSGGEVKYAGWRLLGAIESASGSYLINTVPGEAIPVQFKNRDEVDPLYCDHCKVRRHRHATFIVAHEDGSVKQVGRQCIRDFLGHNSPAQIASYLQHVLDLEDEISDEFSGDSSAYLEPVFSALDFLTMTRTVMREIGWVSRSAAKNSWDGEQATCDIAFSVMMPAANEKDRAEKAAFMAKVTDADRKFAADALAWAPSLWEGKDDVSDYIWNLQSALESKLVGAKTIGLVASLLSCYAKHLEMEIINKKRSSYENNFLGNVGEKITVKVEVSFVHYIENDWGTTQLVKFLTAEGNTLVWFCSSSKDYEVGERCQITGKVKKHETYRDTTQTILTRCSTIPLDRVYAKLTAKQADLVSSKVTEVIPYSEDVPETLCMDDTLLCIPSSAVERAQELVAWLNTQGRVGKGAVKKIMKNWDTEEMGEIVAAA